MGLIINHQLDISVKAIFDQLKLEYRDQFAGPCFLTAARATGSRLYSAPQLRAAVGIHHEYLG